MMSRPSGVQVGDPNIQVLSKVSCLGVPPVTGTTHRSETTPATIPRTNTTFEPSGEKAGKESYSWFDGEVSGWTAESARESNVIQARFLSSWLSEKARTLPPGDQSRPGPENPVCSLCSVPPRAGTV